MSGFGVAQAGNLMHAIRISVSLKTSRKREQKLVGLGPASPRFWKLEVPWFSYQPRLEGSFQTSALYSFRERRDL